MLKFDRNWKHELILGLFTLQGINFYTQTKTVTQLWRSEDASDTKATTAMPVMR